MNQISIQRQHLTIAEFSKYSSLSASTIRRLIRSKQLSCSQPGGTGTRILIPIDALSRLEHKVDEQVATTHSENTTQTSKKLSGRTPGWQRKTQ